MLFYVKNRQKASPAPSTYFQIENTFIDQVE